jgi:outer membrane protein insertion porin family
MNRRLSFSKLAGVLCLSLLVWEPVSAQMGALEVSALRFHGNQSFSDDALANAILTRETECRSFVVFPFCLAGVDFSLDPRFLNEREFKRDFDRVRLFYYLRGFRETVVDTVVDRSRQGEIGINFHVQEGEPIRVQEVGLLWLEEVPDPSASGGPPLRVDTTSFPGIDEVPDSLGLSGIPIRVGEPLSLIALESSRDSLLARLKNRGYAHGEVLIGYTIPPEAPYEAQVDLEVFPGPLTRFGPVTVEITATKGRVPTMDEEVVKRMLPFREGDVYQEDLQFAGQRNLYNLEIFRFVRFDPDTLSPVDSILPISIKLEEDDVHRVRTGGGLNTAECINFEASWHSRNFLGGARRLQLTGRLANVLAPSLSNTILCNEYGEENFGDLTGSISVDFNQPWFFSPRNSVSGGVFLERQSVAPVFIREAVGLRVGLNRTLGIGTLLGLSYGPELTRLTAAEVFFCSAYLICAPEEIQLMQGNNLLSPVSLTLSRDRRNQALSPTRGYSLAADLEHAAGWTGSDFIYTRVLADATWYAQLRSNWVLATHLKGGWVGPGGFEGFSGNEGSNEIVHPGKRLYGGGSNSVRGFAQNRLGPRVLYLDDVERLMKPRGDLVPCAPTEVADLSCNAGLLPDELFFPSPTGGTRQLEGSLELRFPVSGRLWEGATFLDFGQVWDESDSPRLADLEMTPGFGVRYFSPIGPIRIDLGYRFGSWEELPVVTQRIELRPNSSPAYEVFEDLVVLDSPIRYGEGLSAWSPRRFQLHLSIGQAF